jgi:hypothetical protein
MVECASLIAHAKTGTRLQFCTQDGSFEGIVYAVDIRNSFVTFKNAVDAKTGQSLGKLCNVAVSDISKCEIVGGTEKKAHVTKLPSQSAVVRRKDRCVRHHPLCTVKTSNCNFDSLTLTSVLGVGKKSGTDEVTEVAGNDVLDYGDGCKTVVGGVDYGGDADAKQLTTAVVTEIGSAFYDALADIISHKVIGLACQGITIGRNGQLCFLQISTPCQQTYIYDILSLGCEAFDAGLRQILESPNVQKVIFNCRCLSDMLYHQYDVILTNVFDCQVAHISLFCARYHGVVPRYVGSLATCLLHHLRLPVEEIFFHRSRVYSSEEDEAVWCHRPATNQMLEAARKNVIYLCQLRIVMMEKMLCSFRRGTNIFLNTLRRQSDEDREQANPRESQLLPSEFVRAMRFSKFIFSNSTFFHNCDVFTRDPFIGIAHDSISYRRDPVEDERLRHLKQTHTH